VEGATDTNLIQQEIRTVEVWNNLCLIRNEVNEWDDTYWLTACVRLFRAKPVLVALSCPWQIVTDLKLSFIFPLCLHVFSKHVESFFFHFYPDKRVTFLKGL
jgi:hypothetical protein